ncbi:MAG: efflux RND transporter permease subunit, partial [bacterium]|nr:efflux RND transporter permease subunit [bacterium]
MSLINLSVKRPVGTIMFYIGVILLGMISYFKLATNLLPDLSYPKITVVTRYAGSGPEEIERFITSELEGPLASITGIKRINSVSKEGVSVITLEFHWGTDMDFAMLHTKERTEEVRSRLPDDHDPPIIMEMDPTAAAIMIAILSSDKIDLKDQKETAQFIIKPRLEQLEGISSVELRGGNEEEISVEIDPEKVKNLGITLTQISSSIRQNNGSVSGGTVKKDKFRYTLKIEGELKTPAQIEEVVVEDLTGRAVRIKDIGRAFYKNKVRDGDIRFNSSSAISLLLYRESGGNTVDATEAAEKAIDELQKELDSINITIISKEAELIVASLESLKLSLILGMAMAIFILLLFLQNYRDPMLVALAIPISVIATFILMFFFDVQVNIMSLGGLVLGVGMFVDNCIIVLESIYRHRDTEKLIPSVINGAKEVSGAIAASTLTTISIFLPVIYLYGITGKLFRDQALTVSFSLICSLIVAITILPALSAFKAIFKTDFIDDIKRSREDAKKGWAAIVGSGLNFALLLPFRLLGYIIYFILGGIMILIVSLVKFLGKALSVIMKPLYYLFEKWYKVFDEFYHKILLKMLNKKVLALYLSIFIFASIALTFKMLDKELLPAPENSKFEIRANTIPAYGFEETNRIAIKLEKQLLKSKGVDFVFTESGAVSQEAGRSEDISVNSIHYIIQCKNPEIRSQEMIKARKIMQSEGLQDVTVFLEQNTMAQYLSTGGENYQIKIFYSDINKGKEAVKLVLDAIKDLQGLNDLKTTTTEGKPTFSIDFKQELLDELN